MEGKKRLAACCLIVVMLLSAQHRPAAAMSKFCRCYKECYAECRKDTGVYPCNVNCLQDCIKRPATADQQLPTTTTARRPMSAVDCSRFCLGESICGVMSTASTAVVAGDAQACLVDCRKSIGHSAPLKDATTN